MSDAIREAIAKSEVDAGYCLRSALLNHQALAYGRPSFLHASIARSLLRSPRTAAHSNFLTKLKNLPGLLRAEGSPRWSSATANPAAFARFC